VIITRKLAEKIGASKLSEQVLEGVVDSGGKRRIQGLGGQGGHRRLEFHDCFIHATPREIAQVDGTIGKTCLRSISSRWISRT